MSYRVLSPDGISLDFKNTKYRSKAAARRAIAQFATRYEFQGYYSSARFGRIAIDEIANYCIIIPNN